MDDSIPEDPQNEIDIPVDFIADEPLLRNPT